jgi:hypothetical protein
MLKCYTMGQPNDYNVDAEPEEKFNVDGLEEMC